MPQSLSEAHTGSVKRRDRNEDVYTSVPGTDGGKDEATSNAAEEGAGTGTRLKQLASAAFSSLSLSLSHTSMKHIF